MQLCSVIPPRIALEILAEQNASFALRGVYTNFFLWYVVCVVTNTDNGGKI